LCSDRQDIKDYIYIIFLFPRIEKKRLYLVVSRGFKVQRI